MKLPLAVHELQNRNRLILFRRFLLIYCTRHHEPRLVPESQQSTITNQSHQVRITACAMAVKTKTLMRKIAPLLLAVEVELSSISSLTPNWKPKAMMVTINLIGYSLKKRIWRDKGLPATIDTGKYHSSQNGIIINRFSEERTVNEAVIRTFKKHW